VLPAPTVGAGVENPDSEGEPSDLDHDDGEAGPGPEPAADPEDEDTDPPDDDDEEEVDELDPPDDEDDEDDELETETSCRTTGFSPVGVKRVVGPALELGAYDVQPEMSPRICRTVRAYIGGSILSPSSEHARVGLDC
jgi:hypothetical protein